MARVSKIRLDYKTYIQILDTLDLVLGKMKKDEVRSFLFSLFGKNERIMISKRFAAVLLLNSGLKKVDISRRLKITKQTIDRLSRTKELKNEGFFIAVNKISQNRMNKEINAILLGVAKGSAEVFLKWRIRPPNDYPKRNLRKKV